MLRFDSIHFSYARAPVLQAVGFTAEPGQITCVVGPSGCGKTTLLNLAAGLLPVQQGSIQIDDRVVGADGVHVPPEQRSVGLVFQEGALFPHLSVRDNITFGMQGGDIEQRLAALLAVTDLSELIERLPHELSGGQRQRVALARALAAEPRVLLFDEPYSNLDQSLRRQLREETRRIIAELGTVAVFVTHDSDDVTALADTVVALDAGQIVQAGSPRELFDRPQHVSVARLFGNMQRIAGVKSGDSIETPFGPWPVDCLSKEVAEDGALGLLVRPDGLVLTEASDGYPVTELRVAGEDDLVGVQGANECVAFVRVYRPHGLKPGVRVAVRPLPARVFPDNVANETHSQ